MADSVAPFGRWMLALAVAAAAAAAAQPGRAAPCELDRDRSGRVAAIVDGDTLFIDDGTEVRLVGIQAPKPSLGRAGFAPWPLADRAKAALGELSRDRTVTLSYGGARRDRHGRALAHLHGSDDTWIQGELLRRGLARVYSFRDNRACVREMLALEREARRAGRGMWRLDRYAVRSLAEAPRHSGSFQLVEGRVLEVATVRRRAYLNFGEDWRTDFTVAIAPRDRRLFLDEGVDPTRFEGRRVRVRGWLRRYNGPLIEVTHPEQIEIVDE